MADQLKVARLYLLLLAIFTVGRWAHSLQHASYNEHHHIFSLVTLTLFCSLLFAAFCRKWRGYTLMQAATLGFMLGLAAQIVILLSTLISYGLGIDTFFTNPRALNVDAPISLSEALPRRLAGVLAGSVSSSIVGLLGWLMGALLPERSK